MWGNIMVSLDVKQLRFKSDFVERVKSLIETYNTSNQTIDTDEIDELYEYTLDNVGADE